MGIHNRPYWKDGSEERSIGGGGFSLGLPPLGRVVKYLLLINVIVFVLQVSLEYSRQGQPLEAYFGASLAGWWQIWRYVTFQFLHGGFWHIALNMLGLYLLGSPLEQYWGPGRFLRFYLGCGAFAGVLYVAACSLLAPEQRDIPLIGASGGVFAIVLACAVLFPQFKLVLLIFPVPIRLAAILIFGFMIANIIGGVALRRQGIGGDFWTNVAHLGGAVAAAFYLWIMPHLGEARLRRAIQGRGRIGSGAWQRRMDKMAAEQAEIDRILQKIHDQGLASLTKKEQKRLKNATKRQQQQERELYR